MNGFIWWEAAVAIVASRCQRDQMDEPQRSNEWRRKVKGCGCLLLIFVLAPLFLLKACQWSDRHPADRAMIQEFQDNRAAFSDLLKMVSEERRVTRVADDFIWIDGAQNVPEAERSHYVSDARLARYRSLFRTLKLESGIVRREDGSVGFLRSSSGIVPSGSSKEFVWSRGMTAPVLAPSDDRSLEDACIAKTGCSSIRSIAPQWYISFSSN